MSDDIQMPSVKTTIRIGNFTLYVYAYKILTEPECKLALRQYLQQFKLKSVPKSGSAKIITLFGSNPEDYV